MRLAGSAIRGSPEGRPKDGGPSGTRFAIGWSRQPDLPWVSSRFLTRARMSPAGVSGEPAPASEDWIAARPLRSKEKRLLAGAVQSPLRSNLPRHRARLGGDGMSRRSDRIDVLVVGAQAWPPASHRRRSARASHAQPQRTSTTVPIGVTSKNSFAADSGMRMHPWLAGLEGTDELP
jgi:hypothetical protein